MSYWRVTAGAWPDQVLYMSMGGGGGGRRREGGCLRFKPHMMFQIYSRVTTHAIIVSPFQRRNIPFAGYTSASKSKNTRRRIKNPYFQQMSSTYLCFILDVSNCEQTLQFKKPNICPSCSRLKAVDST